MSNYHSQLLKTLPEKAHIPLNWLRRNHTPTSTLTSSYNESKDFRQSSVAKQHTGSQYDMFYTSDRVG
ncbi:hypothetical protein BT93_G1640 [Corymbia citriodora subsp. variegata]|nr:hypothetical protein BT93_G1640 [Corymbia citriodora subsp. variegata]